MDMKTEALKHFDAGRKIVPCNGKRPVGTNWAYGWCDRPTVAAYFGANPGANLGLILGDFVDFEWDDPEQEEAFKELFAGEEIPRTPCFASTRGKHYFFQADPRLTELDKAEIHYKKLGVRVGAKQAQSVIPPSRNSDGTQREWEVSFDDCEPAKLPKVVVDRILEHLKKPEAKPTEVMKQGSSTEAAVSAMLQMHMEDGKDGSKRLFAYGCRAVEHDLTDNAALAAIRAAAAVKPFPKNWSNRDIVKRLRDAEKTTTRGSASSGPTIWQAEGQTEAANARRLAGMFGSAIRWCDPWSKWLIWDGKRWTVDKQRAIDTRAKAVAASLWQEFFKGNHENKAVYNFVRGSSSANGIRNMVSLARSESGLTIVPDQLDQDHFLLNLTNGTLDLRTGVIRPHCQADYLTKLAPVEFSETAECPVWMGFLEKVFAGDTELIGFVKRLCGYCLTGDVSEQMLAILHGAGSNGKSTLLNSLLEIAGEYGSKVPASLLLDKGNEHPTGMAGLAGKRFAVVSESDEGKRMGEAKIKELTGGEKITARRMREDFWTFSPTHKLLFATNHKPTITGTDHAIWRRIRLVPFNVIIADADQDKSLPEKLRGEYPGILRWMVKGCLEWQKVGLGVPKSVAVATAAYRDAEDVLAEFLASCCEERSDASFGAADLLKAFQDFTGDKHMNAKRLSGLLEGRGFTKGRVSSGTGKGRVVWFGVGRAPTAPPVELPAESPPAGAFEYDLNTAA